MLVRFQSRHSHRIPNNNMTDVESVNVNPVAELVTKMGTRRDTKASSIGARHLRRKCAARILRVTGEAWWFSGEHLFPFTDDNV